MRRWNAVAAQNVELLNLGGFINLNRNYSYSLIAIRGDMAVSVIVMRRGERSCSLVCPLAVRLFLVIMESFPAKYLVKKL